MTTFNLWWSLVWRLTLLLLLLSFVLHPLAQVFLGIDSVTLIKMRPSVTSWLLAILLWVSAAISPRFVSLVLWAERLGLTAAQWLTVCRGVSLFLVVLGVCNLVVAHFASTAAWVNFKLFFPYPLFVLFLAVLAATVKRARPQR